MFQRSKILISISLIGMLCVPAVNMMAQGQAPATSAPQKNWKDRAEYDLYDALSKDTNPKTRLEKLQQWEKQYPQTDYAKERRLLFLTTAFALGQPKETADAAKQVLADDPKNFIALYALVSFTRPLAGNNPTPDVLDQGDKAANALLADINTAPPNVTEDQWKTQKPQIEELGHTTLGWIAMQKKNWQASEAEFQKSLAL